MASNLLSRSGISRLLGFMFHGQRDTYKVFGYSNNIKYEQAVGRYRRQDIAARIVEAPANALWSNPPELKTSDTTWDKAWEKLELTQKLWKSISRADKMSGMGEFSVLLLGFADGRKLETPVRRVGGQEVTYLQPYGFDAIEIESLVEDKSSNRFLLPEIYKITPTKGMESNKLATNPTAFKVHASRILHIGENYLTNEVFGNPRIERIWNLLDDLLKVAGGTAETYWLTGNRGMQVDIDKEMELTDADEKALSDEIDEYQHELRRVMRTRGVKVNMLGSDIPNPQPVFNMIMSMISGATGIPKRILLGSEAGQLASEQDRNNWAERIEERRFDFGEPEVVRPLIELLTDAGVLPTVDPSKVLIKWPDAFRLTPFEKASSAGQIAKSAINLSKMLESPQSVVSRDEARTILGLGITAEELEEGDAAADENAEKEAKETEKVAKEAAAAADNAGTSEDISSTD